MIKEFIGIIAAIIVAVSMCFKTSSYKGTLLLRLFNTLGSIIFIIYGLILPAYSTALLNILAVIINIYRMLRDTKEIKEKEKL